MRYPPGAAACRADFVPPARRAVCHARSGRGSAGGVPRGIYRGRQCDGFFPQLPYAARQRRKSCLRQLAETVREVFQPVQDACQMPARRAEIPFGGKELQTIYLAQLLYLLARRRRRTHKQSPVPAPSRSRQPLWKACACTLRRTLKSRWRWTRCAMPMAAPRGIAAGVPRPHPHGADGVFLLHESRTGSAAADPGYGPGETARMLGYGSLAWFSRRFHALTGQTPGAYRRAPHPLHLCER